MYTISKVADEINDSRVKDDVNVVNVVDEDEEEVVDGNEYEDGEKDYILDLDTNLILFKTINN